MAETSRLTHDRSQLAEKDWKFSPRGLQLTNSMLEKSLRDTAQENGNAMKTTRRSYTSHGPELGGFFPQLTAFPFFFD